MRVLADLVEDLLVENGSVSRGKAALEGALQSEDATLRERAADLLVSAIPRAQARARDAILHMLQAFYWPPTPAVAARAFAATLPVMESVGHDSPEATDVPLLWSNLARVNPDVAESVGNATLHARASVRRAAVGALGRMGRLAQDYMDRVARLLQDEDPLVAEMALQSLSALGPLNLELSLEALRAEIRTAKGNRRFLALSALRGLLEHARIVGAAVTPDLTTDEGALVDATTDSEAAVRLQAVALLGLRAMPAPRVESTLVSSLKDASADVAAAAAVALLRLQASMPAALGLLEQQLCSQETARQDAAVYALEPLEEPVLSRARPALEAGAEKAKGVAKEASIGLLLRLERNPQTR